MRRGQRKGRWWLLIILLLTLAGMGHIALRAADSAPLWELILGLVLGVVTPVVYLVGAARLQSPRTVPEPKTPAETPEP